MSDEEIVEHLGLVHREARRVRAYSKSIEYEDLVGYGTVGLMQAARSFDASRGWTFSTFAIPRIRGAMIDELRRRFGRSPVSAKRLAEEVALDDTLADPADDEREVFTRLEVDEVLGTLPPRQRRVLTLYYLDGLVQREIGLVFGVREQRIQQIRSRALHTLHERFQRQVA